MYADVLVFVEAELCGAASQIERFVVARKCATSVGVAPRCTALLAGFEDKRRCGGGGRHNSGEGNKSELHDGDSRVKQNTGNIYSRHEQLKY